MKCEVKQWAYWHLRPIMGGAFMAYNEWGIYGLRVWLWLK